MFRPSETPNDDFHLSRADDLGHLRFGAQLHVDYANDPLVFEEMAGDRDSESLAVVAHQLNLTLGLSLGIGHRLVVFAGLPVVALMQGDDEADLDALGLATPDGGGLGDAYLGARVVLVDEALGAVALQLTGTFPTAGDQRFRGDEFLSLHPELLLELRPGAGSRITLNAGGYVRENIDGGSNLAYSDQLTFGVGVGVPIWTASHAPGTHIDLHAQLYGATAFSDFFTRDTTPVEAIGGFKLFHASGMVVGLAGGAGITRGFGSPNARAVALIGYAMPEPEAPPSVVDSDGDGLLDPDDRCPAEPEDPDSFEDTDGCPDPDNDADGILDTEDRCPLEPENANDWEDDDGCPDEIPDTDGDGIRDNVDQCVSEPEDADAWDDTDGCPDPDNDNDGVLDTRDRCPTDAGPIENVGCPDTDRDSDTVVDRLDNCPDEPGPPENQGCQARQQVRIEEGRLEILDKVYFRTDRDTILRRSYPLLQNVASVLNAHPEITHVQVEGHTDSRGDHAHNVELSQRRAESVVQFLVNEGVDAARLVARGFGPDRPIVADATTRDEHAQNRRVEFNLMHDGDGIVTTDSGPSDEEADR